MSCTFVEYYHKSVNYQQKKHVNTVDTGPGTYCIILRYINSNERFSRCIWKGTFWDLASSKRVTDPIPSATKRTILRSKYKIMGEFCNNALGHKQNDKEFVGFVSSDAIDAALQTMLRMMLLQLFRHPGSIGLAPNTGICRFGSNRRHRNFSVVRNTRC